MIPRPHELVPASEIEKHDRLLTNGGRVVTVIHTKSMNGSVEIALSESSEVFTVAKHVELRRIDA